MKKTISLFFLGMTLCLTACRQQMPKAYITELDSNDSLTIAIGNSEMTNYHSERLGIDITYPSYLRHQYLEEDQMEVFMTDDVSLSFMVKHIDENLRRSPGQDMMGMGAELLDAGDDYSIHTGQDGDLEYYGKVIDDSLRFITVILRYDPKHAEAVEPLKELVRDYKP
ncbi:MAG: hypothetical protein IJ069_13595 [Prevotella sp.]|nr:hypothetical protein [Prevotella sp.]MBQ8154686.1 hypothetical protein [Prevotella sp.]